jgi:hypothetical protein
LEELRHQTAQYFPGPEYSLFEKGDFLTEVAADFTEPEANLFDVELWRGTIANVVYSRLRNPSVQHEIVHIYAPNNNRFLAEGLAVYLHTKLGGNPAFPNFGEDLRRSAVRSVSGVKSLESLNSVRTPRPLSSVMDEKTAYILAGSFVGFLIETYGLLSFRSLYETDNYEKVYEKSLDTLEKEWRVSIQGK